MARRISLTGPAGPAGGAGPAGPPGPPGDLTQAVADGRYAQLTGATFTGAVAGITKAMVGLGSVDNTSDAAKPISTATQLALDLKANLAGAAFSADITVPDEAYDATAWNGSFEVPTKNAIRDKFESLGSAAGDVVGPASATDGAIARYSGTTGKLLQNSLVTINATGGMTASGFIKSNDPAEGVGYSTGAGGTATQATNKATAVTVNTICGQITTHSAALAGNAEVSFTVNNSVVDATDVPMVAISSGAAASATYVISVTAVAAGSFEITLGNISATSRSDTLVINFVIIKAVNT